MPAPVSVMFARFPGGNSENPDTTDWLIPSVIAAKADNRINSVRNWRINDTPITMGRNRCLQQALAEGVDFLFMLDSDMKPDAYHPSNITRIGTDPTAKKFFESSFDFLFNARQAGNPCVVGAPYCGPPPHENVYVFHWDSEETGHPMDQDIQLSQYGRLHASEMRGIKECGALPTGLIGFDMQVFTDAPLPLTYYEWTHDDEAHKSSTEDVTLTRDLALRGFTQYCNWDAWAGHWKMKCVGRPVPITSKQIGKHFREVVMRDMGGNSEKGEEFQIIGSGANAPGEVDNSRLMSMSPVDDPLEAGENADGQEEQSFYEENQAIFIPERPPHDPVPVKIGIRPSV